LVVVLLCVHVPPNHLLWFLHSPSYMSFHVPLLNLIPGVIAIQYGL
jgi:hypothetical protein